VASGLADAGGAATLRGRTIIFLLVFLVIGVVAWRVFWKRSAEPKFEGKTLTQWMLGEGKDGWFEKYGATSNAFRAMGTSAIPTLLRMVAQTNNSLTRAKVAVAVKTQLTDYPITAQKENAFGERGFAALGREASNAVPGLTAIYRQNLSEWSQYAAIRSIGDIGSPQEVFIFMNEALTNRNVNAAALALRALTPTNTPQVSVPRLVEAITNPASKLRMRALYLLEEFGTNAREASPALVPLATTPGKLNERAKYALFSIDPETALKHLTNQPFIFSYLKSQRAIWLKENPTNAAEVEAKFRAKYGLPEPMPAITNQ
jgi:hypothetical protein